ncbi:MAG: DUF359 domain-containing protein [Nitrososphaera sp.]|jgi:uncharacterized protein (UPF0218 family)
MPISNDLLLELKKPFGKLILDTEVTKERLLEELDGSSGSITVGDATLDRMNEFGLFADLSIVDGKERRFSRAIPQLTGKVALFNCSNPAGTITDEAIKTINESLESLPARIVVRGEEDLLALAVCALAPEGFVVLYGQPHEGLVAVKLSEENKRRAALLMDRVIHENK